MSGPRWHFGIQNFRVVSKTRSYEVHFHPFFLKLIKGLMSQFRVAGKRGSPFWVAPSDEALACQTSIAWVAKDRIGRNITGDVALDIEVYGTQDADNALKVILDGLQESGRLKNDRQVRSIQISHKWEARDPGFVCTVTEL